MVATAKRKTAAAHDIVQLKNPRSQRYIKIDRTEGSIIGNKKSAGPYKGIPIAKKRK